MTYADLLDQLQQFDLLRDRPPVDLEQIAIRLRSQQLQPQATLFRVGEAAESLYWIGQGQIGVFVADGAQQNHESLLRVLGRGAIVGEMSLIDGQPRSATCRALELTQLYELTATDFRQSLTRSPSFAQALLAGLSQRLRYTNQFLSEVGAGVQQLAAGQYDSLAELQSPKHYADHSLEQLASAFAHMALQVQQREAVLQERIRVLELEIDVCRVQQSVTEVTESEFFVNLQAQARRLRRDRHSR